MKDFDREKNLLWELLSKPITDAAGSKQTDVQQMIGCEREKAVLFSLPT